MGLYSLECLHLLQMALRRCLGSRCGVRYLMGDKWKGN